MLKSVDHGGRGGQGHAEHLGKLGGAKAVPVGQIQYLATPIG